MAETVTSPFRHRSGLGLGLLFGCWLALPWSGCAESAGRADAQDEAGPDAEGENPGDEEGGAVDDGGGDDGGAADFDDGTPDGGGEDAGDEPRVSRVGTG
jgi:hypothetical protein